MTRTQVGALAALALVAALVLALTLQSSQAPLLPADEEHARFLGPAACQVCHGPDGVYPQSENHPLRTDCLDCHGRP